MTKEEFLIDTINHYNSTNRCESSDRACKYSPITIDKKETEGCAIGRHLDPDLAYQIDKELERKNNAIENVMDRYSLPEWMIQLGKDFLSRVQLLHDYTSNWDTQGLSERGWDKVKSICYDFDIDFELIETNYKIKTNSK